MLTRVRLRSIVCAAGEVSDEKAIAGELAPEGELIEGSYSDVGFRALVSWSVEPPEGTRPPVTISGRHELTFTIKKPISASDAEYYAEINSVILVFPYIRQLVEDMSVRSLGRSVMIPPLDVPQFVIRKLQERVAAHASEMQERAGVQESEAQEQTAAQESEVQEPRRVPDGQETDR